METKIMKNRVFGKCGKCGGWTSVVDACQILEYAGISGYSGYSGYTGKSEPTPRICGSCGENITNWFFKEKLGSYLTRWWKPWTWFRYLYLNYTSYPIIWPAHWNMMNFPSLLH